VRLKKYVVTDEVTKKVPIEREEVRVEREPFDSTGRGQEDASGAEPTERPE
jgi:stress response protein YsnF